MRPAKAQEKCNAARLAKTLGTPGLDKVDMLSHIGKQICIANILINLVACCYININ